MMALDAVRGRVGKYRIRLRPLDDSTLQSGGWDPDQTTQTPGSPSRTRPRSATSATSTRARRDLDPAPEPRIDRPDQPREQRRRADLNRARSVPGRAGEVLPDRHPHVRASVPSDALQAPVQVHLAQSLGCAAMFVLDDGEVDGEDEALTFALDSRVGGAAGRRVQEFPPNAPDYRPLALSVAQSGADCVLLSAIDERSAARLTDAARGGAARRPDLRLEPPGRLGLRRSGRREASRSAPRLTWWSPRRRSRRARIRPPA